jgi:hypothetical protein
MYDQIELGASPTNEPCVQVSDQDYMDAMRQEARKYKALLESMFPAPENGEFRIKSFPHDFGSYLEVCACFDSLDEKAIEWAFNVEENLPEYWS